MPIVLPIIVSTSTGAAAVLAAAVLAAAAMAATLAAAALVAAIIGLAIAGLAIEGALLLGSLLMGIPMGPLVSLKSNSEVVHLRQLLQGKALPQIWLSTLAQELLSTEARSSPALKMFLTLFSERFTKLKVTTIARTKGRTVERKPNPLVRRLWERAPRSPLALVAVPPIVVEHVPLKLLFPIFTLNPGTLRVGL